MSQQKPAPYRVEIELGGRTLILESGKIARQANGAVVATLCGLRGALHRVHGHPRK